MIKTILFINSHSEIAGGEVVLLNLLRSIDRTRFLPIVTCPGDGIFNSTLKDLDIPVVRLEMSRSLGRGSKLRIGLNMARFVPTCFTIVKQLVKIIKDNKVDLVHAGTFQSLLYATFAKHITKIPLIWHCHEFILYGQVGIQFMKSADYIITTSHALRKNLLTNGIQSPKVSTVHCSVDPSIFDNVKPFDLEKHVPGLNPGKTIVTIGRLVPFKGQDIFIHAATRILRYYPDTLFLVVGGPLFTSRDFMDYLRDLVKKLGISDRVLFLGHQNNVPGIINQADILVMPSRAEPFGITALEGMMCGKPVIVTSTSGAAEIITHLETGLIVPPLDPGTIADTAIKLFETPQLAFQLGKNAKITAEKEHTPKIMVEQIQDIFQKVIKTYRPR